MSGIERGERNPSLTPSDADAEHTLQYWNEAARIRWSAWLYDPIPVTYRKIARPASAAPPLFVVVVAVLTAHEWAFLHRLGWRPWGKTDVPWPSATAYECS